MEEMNYACGNMNNEPGYEAIRKAREAIQSGEFYDTIDIITELKRNKQQAARTAILTIIEVNTRIIAVIPMISSPEISLKT